MVSRNNMRFKDGFWYHLGKWLLAMGGIVGGVVLFDVMGEHFTKDDIERQKTRQAEIQACTSIEDEALRLLCIGSPDKDEN